MTIEIPIIPATSPNSSSSRFSGIAWSRMSRSRNGETIPRTAEKAISTRTVDQPAAVGPEEL